MALTLLNFYLWFLLLDLYLGFFYASWNLLFTFCFGHLKAFIILYVKYVFPSFKCWVIALPLNHWVVNNNFLLVHLQGLLWLTLLVQTSKCVLHISHISSALFTLYPHVNCNAISFCNTNLSNISYIFLICYNSWYLSEDR